MRVFSASPLYVTHIRVIAYKAIEFYDEKLGNVKTMLRALIKSGDLLFYNRFHNREDAGVEGFEPTHIRIKI